MLVLELGAEPVPLMINDIVSMMLVIDRGRRLTVGQMIVMVVMGQMKW